MQAVLTNLTLEAALIYAGAWGFAVFPCHSIDDKGFCTCGNQQCKSQGKHPVAELAPNGVKNATRDADQIDAWFNVDNPPNIAIATGRVSDLIVLDLDTAKGAESKDLMVDGVDALVFNTPKVKTGAGLHFYYRYPENADTKNSTSRLGKFIDVRGDGGYVIAPPSKHLSGRLYAFQNDLKALLDFPAEWIAKLNAPASASPAAPSVNGNGHTNGLFVSPPSPGLKIPEQIDFGKRNNTLISLAGLMRHHGFSEGAIYSALNIENQIKCKPPVDDKELHDIARSAGRYAPNHPIDPVEDDDSAAPAADADTLEAFYYRDFKAKTFTPKEILALHIGKGDVAMLAGATNAGKSTLLRNILMCMGAGRPFMPFFDGRRPIKTVYFDLETDAEDLHRDTGIMDQVFTADELHNLGENLIVVPKGILKGDLFQFNTHEDWINFLIKKNDIEFVAVDNVSAAFDLRDENSGSEVTKKVMKPLGKLAMQGHCGVAFAHHFGKAKQDLADTSVHASRGSSSFQNLSRTVFNMYGNVSKGEPATVECAKRKTDGGQGYQEVLRLKDDRWFHHTTIAAAPRPKSCVEAIVDLLKANNFRKVRAKEIVRELEPTFHRATIFRTLKDAVRIKMVETFAGNYWLAGEDEDGDENG